MSSDYVTAGEINVVLSPNTVTCAFVKLIIGKDLLIPKKVLQW